MQHRRCFRRDGWIWAGQRGYHFYRVCSECTNGMGCRRVGILHHRRADFRDVAGCSGFASRSHRCVTIRIKPNTFLSAQKGGQLAVRPFLLLAKIVFFPVGPAIFRIKTSMSTFPKIFSSIYNSPFDSKNINDPKHFLCVTGRANAWLNQGLMKRPSFAVVILFRQKKQLSPAPANFWAGAAFAAETENYIPNHKRMWCCAGAVRFAARCRSRASATLMIEQCTQRPPLHFLRLKRLLFFRFNIVQPSIIFAKLKLDRVHPERLTTSGDVAS